jgi:hypothetical protein
MVRLPAAHSGDLRSSPRTSSGYARVPQREDECVSDPPPPTRRTSPIRLTAWMPVAGSALISRKATLEPPMLPANPGERRFPRSRTRVATRLSENASELLSGEERRVDTCLRLGGAPGRAVSTASRARFHVAVRLAVNGSAANTACSRTCG